MKIEQFDNKNMFLMNQMHDCIIESIRVIDNVLEIKYNDLDKEVFNIDGTPIYQYKKLTIKYILDDYDGFCYLTVFSSKRYKQFDINKFVKKYPNYKLSCYRIYVSNEYELMLCMDVAKIKNDKHIKTKYSEADISMRPKEIIYYWEE